MSVRDCLISIQTMSETEDQVKCLTLFLACVLLLFPAMLSFCMHSATYKSMFEKLCVTFSCFPNLNKIAHFDKTCCGHIVCFCTFSLFFFFAYLFLAFSPHHAVVSIVFNSRLLLRAPSSSCHRKERLEGSR